MTANLIVIQGGSAVGKTTLAQRLATDLGLHLLTKDNFKELLYDVLGTPPGRDESEVYGLAATKALYASVAIFLSKGKSIIIESAFHTEFANLDIEAIVKDGSAGVVQIYVTASPKVRVDRYNERIASDKRHKSHPDSIGAATEEYFANDHTIYGPLSIDDTIEVDTSTFTDDDYSKLLSSVREAVWEKS